MDAENCCLTGLLGKMKIRFIPVQCWVVRNKFSVPLVCLHLVTDKPLVVQGIWWSIFIQIIFDNNAMITILKKHGYIVSRSTYDEGVSLFLLSYFSYAYWSKKSHRKEIGWKLKIILGHEPHALDIPF